MVDAFASALRWDEVNARALNLTTQAAQALVDLAHRLPAELAPTIFEIPVLLSDDDWREAVLPHVSAPVRQLLPERFPRLSPEAITPVTNLVDRLRASPSTAALLGNPLASYDIRAAMDRGLIVLVCPGSGSGRDRLIANFVVYDALHGAKLKGRPSARAPPRVLRLARRGPDIRRGILGHPGGAAGAGREVRRAGAAAEPEPRAADRRDPRRGHHQPLPPGDDGAERERPPGCSPASSAAR